VHDRAVLVTAPDEKPRNLLENDMSRKANRIRKTTTTTAEGCRITTQGNHITLESPKATVIGRITPRGRDLAWLMGDVLSTDSAYRS